MIMKTKEEQTCRDVMSCAAVLQIKIIYCKELATKDKGDLQRTET
jgi:hypothetical protein